jgi:predicted SPOUT superfamily RNA methylase MTH1
MDERPGPDGESLYVSAERERGNKGPFRVTYADPEAERRWGFYCTNCETFDNAVDSMGRIQCNVCSNYHKAEEWDAAHE